MSYHKRKTIDADVEFLTRREWIEELTKLIHDLVDEEGNLLETEQLTADNGEPGVAWSKVILDSYITSLSNECQIHAVYPALTPADIISMTPDSIVDANPGPSSPSCSLLNLNLCNAEAASFLGTSEKVVGRNAEAFGEKIGKYVDSWHSSSTRRQVTPKKKASRSKKATAKVLAEEIETEAPPVDEPLILTYEIWPLIKLVKIRCNSDALSSGAILVDLPGVADANAARGQIAKDYMKSADFIWIVAPITR